jgi:hypothetical protein
MAKKDTAAQIKALIDKGDFLGAQKLINAQITLKAQPPPKRGRPPKVVEERAVIEPPPEPSPQSGCIAPARRENSSIQRTKEIDGKTVTLTRKVEWTKPNKIKFKEDLKIARDEMGLKYPPPTDRREPAQTITYICDKCDRKVELYPGQGPDIDMLYFCDRCMRKKKA